MLLSEMNQGPRRLELANYYFVPCENEPGRFPSFSLIVLCIIVHYLFIYLLNVTKMQTRIF